MGKAQHRSGSILFVWISILGGLLLPIDSSAHRYLASCGRMVELYNGPTSDPKLKSDEFDLALQIVESAFVALDSKGKGSETITDVILLEAIRCADDYTRKYLYQKFSERKATLFWSVLERLSEHLDRQAVSPVWSPSVVHQMARAMEGLAGSQSNWSRLLSRQIVGSSHLTAYRRIFVEGWLQDRDVLAMELAVQWLAQDGIPWDVKATITERLRQFDYPHAWITLGNSNAFAYLLDPRWMEKESFVSEIRSEYFYYAQQSWKNTLNLIHDWMVVRPGATDGEVVTALHKWLDLWNKHHGPFQVLDYRDAWTTFVRIMMQDETRMSWVYASALKSFEGDESLKAQRRLAFRGVIRLLKLDSDYSRNIAAFFLVSGWSGQLATSWIRELLVKKTPLEIDAERDRIRRRNVEGTAAFFNALGRLFGSTGSSDFPYIYEYKAFPRLADKDIQALEQVFDLEFQIKE